MIISKKKKKIELAKMLNLERKSFLIYKATNHKMMRFIDTYDISYVYICYSIKHLIDKQLI